MSRYIDAQGVEHPDRRRHPELRPLFEGVVRRLETYFTHPGLNGQPAELWMARAVRELHPQLDNQQVHVLVAAAARYYRDLPR